MQSQNIAVFVCGRNYDGRAYNTMWIEFWFCCQSSYKLPEVIILRFQISHHVREQLESSVFEYVFYATP